MERKRARGGQPKAKSYKKGQSLSFRPTDDLRDKLELAAAQRRRSISQEIATRLSASFERDSQLRNIFGDEATFEIMRMIASVMAVAVPPVETGKIGKGWLSDKQTFERVFDAVCATLLVFSPSEKRGPYSSENAVMRQMHLWSAVTKAAEEFDKNHR